MPRSRRSRSGRSLLRAAGLGAALALAPAAGALPTAAAADLGTWTEAEGAAVVAGVFKANASFGPPWGAPKAVIRVVKDLTRVVHDNETVNAYTQFGGQTRTNVAVHLQSELDPAGAGGLDGAIAFGASGMTELDLTPSTQISGGAGRGWSGPWPGSSSAC